MTVRQAQGERELRAAIALVEQVRTDWRAATHGADLVGNYAGWRDTFNAATEAAEARLAAAGAKLAHRYDGTTITLAGLRSASTTGTHGAIGNWLVRAQAKLAEVAHG